MPLWILFALLWLSPSVEARVTHADLMNMKPEPNVNENGIGIFVYNGMNALDAIGPYQTLKGAGLKTFLISRSKDKLVTSSDTPSLGLKIVADKSWDEVSKLDVLIVPGGAIGTALLTKDQAVLDWIRKMDQTTYYTGSVCTGAWLLGAAGLLQGKKATTNWYRAKSFLEQYGATFVDKRYVQDGKLLTAAGVTAGIDMALYLIETLYRSKEYTQAVMLDLEYDPKPPVKGGSFRKSPPVVRNSMKEMYDWAFDVTMPGFRPSGD